MLRARRAALDPTRTNAAQHEHRIAGVNQVIDLVAKLVKDLGREPQEVPDPFVPPIGVRHKRTLIDHEHRLGVDLSPEGFPGLVPVVEVALNDLHVLLRHGPPSIIAQERVASRLALMSREGQNLVDVREATVRILVDRTELVMTHARLQPEGGPPLHVHRGHADTFAILGGELHVGLAGEEHVLGEGSAWSAPVGVVHGYQHKGDGEVRFLNLHTPGMGFAEYLFGQRTPEEVDQYEPPEDGGAPPSEATLLSFAEEGETVTDRPERTIRILVDLPELCMTWTRYVPGEEGPGPHIHKEHLDAFFILTGELNFGLGPDVERVKAGPGTFVMAPPHVIHTFRNDGPEDATWFNFHAPSKGFASFLRDTDFVWDSFDAPADGGLPLSEAVVDHVHSA